MLFAHAGSNSNCVLQGEIRGYRIVELAIVLQDLVPALPLLAICCHGS